MGIIIIKITFAHCQKQTTTITMCLERPPEWCPHKRVVEAER